MDAKFNNKFKVLVSYDINNFFIKTPNLPIARLLLNSDPETI